MNTKNIISLWIKFNEIFKEISFAMNGTNNIVGEFAEKLIGLYYNAEQPTASQPSYDLITKDGKRIQVKSRRLEKLGATTLNVIRSWDFDLLIIVIFSQYGKVLKSIEISSDEAKKYAKYNQHQNGWIISTTEKFLCESDSRDITSELNKLLS